MSYEEETPVQHRFAMSYLGLVLARRAADLHASDPGLALGTLDSVIDTLVALRNRLTPAHLKVLR